MSFSEIEVRDGDLVVVLEDIGEGRSGDYDPEDSEDEPLLRFSCYRDKQGELIEVDDCSYCTQLRVDDPIRILERAANVILAEFKRAIDGGGSPKKPMEQMSWISAKDFY